MNLLDGNSLVISWHRNTCQRCRRMSQKDFYHLKQYYIKTINSKLLITTIGYKAAYKPSSDTTFSNPKPFETNEISSSSMFSVASIFAKLCFF